MDGKALWDFLEVELKKQGIKKGEFYDAIGITATAYYGWKNGAEPKEETVKRIESYLGVPVSDVYTAQTTGMDAETAELLNSIRNRPDLGVLLRSARDVPPSSVYSLVAQLEREKENNA